MFDVSTPTTEDRQPRGRITLDPAATREGTWHEALPEGVQLYKFLKRNGDSPYQRTPWSLPTQNEDGTWTPGEWMETPGPYVRCRNGLHLTDAVHHRAWSAERLFAAEVDGGILDAGDKWVAGRVRLTREYGGWAARQRESQWNSQYRLGGDFDRLNDKAGLAADEWNARLREMLPLSLRPFFDSEDALYAEQRRIAKITDYLKGRDLLRRAQIMMGHKLTDRPGDVTKRRKRRYQLDDRLNLLRNVRYLRGRTSLVNKMMIEGQEALSKKRRVMRDGKFDPTVSFTANNEYQRMKDAYVAQKTAEETPKNLDIPAGF